MIGRRAGRTCWTPAPTSTADALAERSRAACAPDDPINIQYTSGTTGFPKGATLSHRNILNNGYFVTETDRLHRAGPARASRCPSTTASAW